MTDGLAGRSHEPIFIAQPRRRKPGWDGCRDREDGRTDLPVELQYRQPFARFNHKGMYVPETDEVFIYGGEAYNEFQANTLSDTYVHVPSCLTNGYTL